MHHGHVDIADLECIAVSEQMIEVGAVPLKFGSGVEQFAEHILHRHDMLANGDLAAELFLQIGCCRQVIGMGVGFKQPFDFQAVLVHISDYFVGGIEGGATGSRVEIKDAVDDGGAFGRRVVHHIGHRIGCLIEK